MVRILSFFLTRDFCFVVNKSSRRFLRVVIPSVLSTLLCLVDIYDSAKAQPSTSNVLSPKTIPQPLAPTLPGVVSYGDRVTLNGRILPGAWLQQKSRTGKLNTHLSDAAIKQLLGVDLLNNNNPTQQPVQWFSPSTNPIVLTSLITTGYRYLDITNFASTAGWQVQANGNTLVISTPSAKVVNIRQGRQTSGDTIIIDLTRPTPWQISQGAPIPKSPISPLGSEPATPKPTLPLGSEPTTPKPTSPPNREWIVTVEGIAEPTLLRGVGQGEQTPSLNPQVPTPDSLIQGVEVANNQTIVRLSVPFGFAPRINTLANPNRLSIEIRPDAMPVRNIVWATGLRWRQQYFNLGQNRFPVTWLEINPRTSGVKLKPIWTNSDTMVGTAPLIQFAQQQTAVAAINGGYFNRNNRLPLGALRRDNIWVSGPILNRGAIAWNDSGQFYIDRLTLQETIVGSNRVQLPILYLNSGYVQSGIARYTPAWGTTYTPLTDDEIVLVVQQNKILSQITAGKAGETAVPIPQDGYLLTFRGLATANAEQLPVNSTIQINSSTITPEFNRYPHIVGAGPVLLKNHQIVLDAKGEKFSDAFIAEKAIRSGICTTSTGNLAIAAIHNRAGGAGPTLAEHAQLMQLLGCVNALNLDGGSSTSLYLGGQLLDRSPNTAARVHNGIGVFFSDQ
ncbi:phosphodiester glycosidase family protein [Scytonema sp. NUACC26]|uniref:phosphodiester glycosidase family protein n=1 Tax=Scytonema sp. NUACC26 TaxID=3140176 RepID=UPI0034DCA2AA